MRASVGLPQAGAPPTMSESALPFCPLGRRQEEVGRSAFPYICATIRHTLSSLAAKALAMWKTSFLTKELSPIKV